MALTIDQLVEKYLELRLKADALKAEYNQKVAPVHDLMAQLEGLFLQHMQANGMESFTTAAGTPYQSTRTSVSVKDWDAFFDFALDSGNEGMLVRGANKTAVEEYVKLHKALPPGLNVNREIVVNVRKASPK